MTTANIGTKPKPYKLPHGYRWRLINAPYQYQDLIGRIYRKSDIEITDELDDVSWAEGLIFHHVKKPIQCRVCNGRLVKIEQIQPQAGD